MPMRYIRLLLNCICWLIHEWSNGSMEPLYIYMCMDWRGAPSFCCLHFYVCVSINSYKISSNILSTSFVSIYIYILTLHIIAQDFAFTLNCLIIVIKFKLYAFIYFIHTKIILISIYIFLRNEENFYPLIWFSLLCWIW